MIRSIIFVPWNRSEELQTRMRAGWEPFAVTEDESGTSIWLRKAVLP